MRSFGVLLEIVKLEIALVKGKQLHDKRKKTVTGSVIKPVYFINNLSLF